MTTRIGKWSPLGWDWRPLWLPLSVMGALAIAASFAVPHGYDLLAYWHLDPTDPYRTTDFLGFRYAPPMVLLFAPLRLLPWEVVVVGWLAMQLACLYYIGGRWFLALVLFPPVWLDIVYGNVNIALAAMVVASFRYPGAWVFGLVTKVTPALGALWLVGRRDWHGLALLGGVVAFVVLASVGIQGPGVWIDWFLTLSQGQPQTFGVIPIPLLPRLAVAAALVLWGGWTDRRWVVPVAVALAMPTLWVIALTPLVASFGLRDRDQAHRDGRVASIEPA